MKIEIKRVDDDFHMESTNENGNIVRSDGSEKIGGHNKGMRPMQMLLASLGSCSSIDVISIMKKQRQPLEDIQITVTGEREQDKVPALFTEINLHFTFIGPVDPEKAEQAVRLSMEKYCSVAKIVEQTAKITWSYEVKASA